METKIKNKHRSKTFGLVINPMYESNESINWSAMTPIEIESNLKALGFPNKYDLTGILNTVKFENTHGNLTEFDDFEGQLELGGTNGTPHYQIALKTKTTCLRMAILRELQEQINGHINIDVQHTYKTMVEYCTKESQFISDHYSGRIYKHEWKLSFLDKKPELKVVIEDPYPWQKFFMDQILSKNPDGRIVDWIIDPVGRTGKSSFARAYVSSPTTDAILMKIDNLDRMELALISKIKEYRSKHNKDPRIVMFDFPRAADARKVMDATALMEDAKSGHLETNFGGHFKELHICNIHVVVFSNNAPDLSVLSIDRWRLWRLGGKLYGNVIWPCLLRPNLRDMVNDVKYLRWNVELRCLIPSEIGSSPQFRGIKFDDWFHIKPAEGRGEVFGASTQFTKYVVNSWAEAPTFIRLEAFDKLSNDPKRLTLF